MIIYKFHINASLNGSKAVAAPPLACGYCSLSEDVLVPPSISIFALNGIFCIDRKKTNKAIINNKTFKCASLCIVCLFLQKAAFDVLILIVCLLLSSGGCG